MFNRLLQFAALALTVYFLALQIMFTTLCTEERDQVLGWKEALKDNEFLNIVIHRLYRQRELLNKMNALALICWLFLLFERLIN